jgi:uncharacterized damage-inducible protein DinB
MSLTAQLAKHFRELHLGGNWTSSNLKDNLADVSWKQATTQVNGLNSIATLVFHINYYVSAVLKVFQGSPLKAHDKYSFDLPPIQSQEDWEMLLAKTWNEAEAFAKEVENLPEDKLREFFTDEKYGNYYRNIQGIIEHCHYHLGQIAIIKKMVQQSDLT